jgi:cell wall-associated NlpC family hydrolase
VEINETDISFIHAANSGVTISQLKESYYSNSFRHINRIIE